MFESREFKMINKSYIDLCLKAGYIDQYMSESMEFRMLEHLCLLI
jgi:hypothetical protein